MDSAFAQKTGRIAAASSPPVFFSFDFFTKITVNPNPSPLIKGSDFFCLVGVTGLEPVTLCRLAADESGCNREKEKHLLS